MKGKNKFFVGPRTCQALERYGLDMSYCELDKPIERKRKMETSTNIQMTTAKPEVTPLIPFLEKHMDNLLGLKDGIESDFSGTINRIIGITEAFKGPSLKSGKLTEESPVTANEATVGDYIKQIEGQTTRIIEDTRQGFSDLNQAIRDLESRIFDMKDNDTIQAG